MRKISAKLFLISLASIILTASVISIPALVSMTQIIEGSARMDMQASMNTIEAVLDQMRRRTLGAAALIARSPAVAEALLEGDGPGLQAALAGLLEGVALFADPCFAAVTDSRGLVLAGSGGAAAGECAADRRGVSRALRLLCTSDIEPKGELELGVVSTVPIVSGGAAIGAALVGYDLGRPEFVDSLKRLTNAEITVFAYDVSIMTTIVSPQTGERLYGVTLAPHIAEAVLGRREIFHMETEIAPRPGELFLAFYKPFLDADGEVLGLVFSGQNLTAARGLERQAIMMSLGFSALVIALVFLGSRIAINRIVALPVRRAMRAVGQLSEGNMEPEELSRRHSRDELGQLLSGTRKMAEAMRAAMERERELGMRLREQEMGERLRAAFDAAPMCIEYWDRGFSAIDCNRHTLELYGSPGKEEYLRGPHATTPEFQPGGEPSVEFWNGRLRKIFEEGHCRFEFADRSAGGDLILTAVDGARLRLDGSDVAITFSSDVTMLKDALEQALSASRAKSAFLSAISHEIRTPMNAIIGMAELLLRGELQDESRGYAQDIKRAGANLLSIINDLLDFSKIEAGKLEIIPARYRLSSLVSDVVSIIRMRLAEKPIRFFTNIDGSIPRSLIGDEARLRQVLLNLLSNAVKYTDKGHIGLSITLESRSADGAWLRIAVSDTGRGIRPEDMGKLFGEFVQVDARMNRSTEGTGLGLAIAKSLCEAMGGSIEASSEYGKGSSFAALVPQGIDSPEPFAAVEEPQEKKALVFERREVYARSVLWSLENMGVPHAIAEDEGSFLEALFREEWFLVVTAYGLYGKIRHMMELPDAAFPGGRKPRMALMLEWGVQARVPNARFVSMPVQSLSLANVLNGRKERRKCFESSGMIQSAYPQARLLAVDDISLNLMVIEGILVPYKAKVDTCLTGAGAVELASEREYDIIFMDHMMPEMDGMEAAAEIRRREKARAAAGGGGRRPAAIVALTANAVSGMREKFLESGFDDFLAKPIDVAKLDKILEKWIPAGKRESAEDPAFEAAPPPPPPAAPAASRLLIPGVDVGDGMARSGGSTAGYRRALSAFCREAERMLPLFREAPSAAALPALAEHAGAAKGAAAGIGAREACEEAALLEAACGEGSLELAAERQGPFAELLSELAENIGIALKLREMWGAPKSPRGGSGKGGAA